ncbi:MAG: DnaB-like helicase N-terminal domain-containing protein [Verrucomicrobiae bacterium]|nr:DnaB-like helicase N-terminal domain-containing protein [Verrucomicrobiae bacterium]
MNLHPTHQRAILGRVLCEDTAAIGWLKAASTSNFPDPLERDIFKVMRQLAAGGEPINLVSIVEAGKKAGDWQMEWDRFLAELFSLGMTISDVGPHIRAIAEVKDGVSVSSEADIRGALIQILNSKGLSKVEQKTQAGSAVVEALLQRGKFYFHAERKDFASSMFFDGQRKTLLRIQSDKFLSWLAGWLSVNRTDSLFTYAKSAVEDAALSGQATRGIIPESFFCSRASAVYLSCGDGRIMKVTPGKVEMTDNGADGILFAAGRTLPAWKITEPKDPFSTCSLFRNVNCAAAHGLDLIRLFFLSLPTCPTCKPPLSLSGDVGSGKTRLARGIAEIYGLPEVVNKVEETGEGDFWVSMDSGGLVILDNADTKTSWLADALAAAATGGCKEKRRLYSDSDTVRLRARSWVAVTSANPTFASDSGLADRLLVTRMNRREGETADAVLSEEIQANRDAALSWVVQTISAALADVGPVPKGLNSRHPDFAAFGVRLGRAMGREQEAIKTLRAAEADKAAFCIEHDVVGAALINLIQLESTEFSGCDKAGFWHGDWVSNV